MTNPLRKLNCICLVLALSTLYATPTQAWGPAGHRIVAMIAQQNIKPQTRQRIKQLMGNASIVSVANWADAIREARPETSNFHFVDIPLNRDTYDAAEDCKPSDKGDCAIAALNRYQAVLRSSASLAKKREALKFVVHLMGDLHQPLHCADNNDRGGNDVKVRWYGSNTNLHKVWDSLIIDAADLTDEEFVEALTVGLTQQKINEIKQGKLLSWVLDAHKIAKDSAYDLPEDKRLDDDYYDPNAEIVDDQLLRGGLRLARVLDWIFSPNASSSGSPFN